MEKIVIGTPLSSSATKVMLLGSGELGKEMAIAWQRLGVEVVAVDRYHHAPAHQVAHRHVVIDMTNAIALKRLILSEQPNYVVPEIEAIATDALVELEKTHPKIKIVPTARATLLTMNREGIRRLAAEELKLPTSPYQFATSLSELQAAATEIGFPCFIKPVMSSSGKGQSKVNSAAELEQAWHYAQTAGRVSGMKVIVEGFIDFDYEITLLTVRARNAAGEIATQFCEPIGHVQVQGDYVESWQPCVMSPRALTSAHEYAQKIVENLGGLGLFGVELFVKGDQVWFSEVSPRPHDTGMVTMITQYFNEFEIHARAILGLPVDTRLRNPGASAVIYGQLEGKGVKFSGINEVLALPNVDVRLFGKPEAFVRRRMGVALAQCPDIQAARNQAKKAAALVKVDFLDG